MMGPGCVQNVAHRSTVVAAPVCEPWCPDKMTNVRLCARDQGGSAGGDEADEPWPAMPSTEQKMKIRKYATTTVQKKYHRVVEGGSRAAALARAASAARAAALAALAVQAPLAALAALARATSRRTGGPP
eukprot:gene1526-biopygen18338